ncbi:30S ribosomal protein S3 [Candidatus Micrarchaeota archaeon]|nr:30S ribosomal protein S3 [Candidatus Micrarchaeota archaeon]
MASEKKFIKKALNDFTITEFLERELDKAGVSKILLTKTPIATRIAIYVRKPGMVVGKKGSTIRELCDVLQQKYGVENPQIEVVEVAKPALDAVLMAEKIGRQIEMRGNTKQIIRFSIKEIMEAGAMGTEIRVAGKIVGKGGKAKTLNVRMGYMKKAGEQAKKVQEGHYTAYLKAGAIGVRVRIIPPGTVFSDHLSKPDIKEETPAEEAAPAEETASPETEQVIEKKLEEAKQEKVKTIRKKRVTKKKEETEGE